MPARKSLLELLKEENFSADKSQKNLNEFVAEKKDIQEALEARWAIRNIYKVLIKAGRITMPYSSFCRHVRSLATTPMQKTAPAAEPRLPVSSKREGFVHDPTPDIKKLV